jgi:hypothetical protein
MAGEPFEKLQSHRPDLVNSDNNCDNILRDELEKSQSHTLIWSIPTNSILRGQ